MKQLKTHLLNCLSGTSLSHIIKIVIDSPDKLKDSDIEEIVEAERIDK